MNESTQPQDFSHERPENVPQKEERLVHIRAGEPLPSAAELEACDGVVIHRRVSVDELLERGAEPFWMQDVRVAQRRLEAARRAIARQRPADSK